MQQGQIYRRGETWSVRYYDREARAGTEGGFVTRADAGRLVRPNRGALTRGREAAVPRVAA